MSSIRFKKQPNSLVSTPDADSMQVFVDADGIVKTKDSSDVVKAVGGPATQIATSGTPIDISGVPPSSTGQVLASTSATSVQWMDVGSLVSGGAHDPLRSPPTVSHPDDDEFSSGSPDLAIRGWTVVRHDGSPYTRIGEVTHPGVDASLDFYTQYRSSIIDGHFYIQISRYNAYPGNGPGMWLYKPITGGLSGTEIGAIYGSVGIASGNGSNSGHAWVTCLKGTTTPFIESPVRVSKFYEFSDDASSLNFGSGINDVQILGLANNAWVPAAVSSLGETRFPQNGIYASSGHQPTDMTHYGLAIGFQDENPQHWFELKFFRRAVGTWVYRP